MIGSVTKRMLKGTRLKEGAFAEKEDLTEITLPDEIEDIGEVAFFGCTNLRQIKLPENLKTIREEAFGESGLESVVIPEGVHLICEKAFFSCRNLKRIDILPKDIVIQEDAFGDTCPERHSEKTSMRAIDYIRRNEALIMERIFKFNNAAALNGITKLGLLRSENINRYVEEAGKNHQAELVTLLLSAARNAEDEDEFSL